jgi:hypothetical protein
MLRITRVEGPGTTQTLKLEGRLAGPWVAALREACGSGQASRLDLEAVQFADEEGVGLLRELLAGGTALVGCSGLVMELLRGGRQ